MSEIAVANTFQRMQMYQEWKRSESTAEKIEAQRKWSQTMTQKDM